ncbi:MAG: hypothetical protein C0424_02560 [Sphingobacteriaceae bacterium]|nr:hypothetical protein [Sphingobacteriaceae bacterium]
MAHAAAHLVDIAQCVYNRIAHVDFLPPKTKIYTLSDWVCVFESNLPWQADLNRVYLEENGIPAIVLNLQDSSYQVFGTVRLMVPSQDRQTAEALLLAKTDEA